MFRLSLKWKYVFGSEWRASFIILQVLWTCDTFRKSSLLLKYLQNLLFTCNRAQRSADELSFSNTACGCSKALQKLCMILHGLAINVLFCSSFLVDFLKIHEVFLKFWDFTAILRFHGNILPRRMPHSLED